VPIQIPTEDDHRDLRDAVRALCARFDGAYWRRVDEARGYPDEFVAALTGAGWLAALVPEEYGGAGLGLTEASIVMEEINRSGGNSGAVHGQMYNMSTLLRAGSPEQKARYLPRIAAGELRLQSMAVTEPGTGTDTTKLRTTATRRGDRWVLNGQKVWTSRLQHSDLMIVLARTTPVEQVRRKSEGLSVFLVDVREALAGGMTVRPIRNMVNHETNEVFLDGVEVPADALVGEQDRGFRIILEGLNAERVLIAAECVGDAYWFVDRARAYAGERVVFDRPIGQNQGIQFPIARAYGEMLSANLLVDEAARLYEQGKPCGTEANLSKLLASEAAWHAGEACIQTFGGFGVAEEYDVERKFRESRLYQIAPISTNLILSYVGEHVLGMPRSY
jgi:acyl-CoA dehydrogenase